MSNFFRGELIMPNFLVGQYELNVAYYKVEADSKAQAVEKLFNGEHDEPYTTEFVKIHYDSGMSNAPISDDEFKEFKKADLFNYDGFVPSICEVMAM